MKKRSLQSLFQVNQLEVTAAFGILLIAGLFIIRLGSLPAHMSSNELQTYVSNHSLHNILNDPLNAPYNLVDYVFLHLPGHAVAFARITSVISALTAVLLFFIIMLRWHGKRTAWLATILFATSGWLLHLGRLGTPNITWLLIPLTLIMLGSWLSRTEHHGMVVITVAALLGLILFVPAGIWFVIAFIALYIKDIARHIRDSLTWQRFVAIALLIVFVAILGYALYRSPHLIREWAGVPQVIPSYVSMAKVWVSSLVLYPFFRGPASPELWLGHTPILDVFTTTMCLLGVYFYVTHFRNIRTRTLVVFVLLGSVLTALNGPAGMSFIIPIAYLIAATGITFLLHQWLTIFPKNPVARFAGITLVTVAIASAVTYHVISYYVAWQHNPEAVAIFQQKP